MPLLSATDDSDRKPPLSRESWVEEGLRGLTNGGIDAVQITRLAKALDVTRGSFYWHFENREALLDALLAEWRARNTDVMLGALAAAETLEDGILALFAIWVDHARFDPALDQAVRDWARRSLSVHEVVQREDDARVAAIAAFYERLGYEPVDAFVRARVLYFSQVSYYALEVAEPMETRLSYLAAYFRCFTGREIDPRAAELFRQMHARAEGTALP